MLSTPQPNTNAWALTRLAVGGEFGLGQFSTKSRIANLVNDSPTLQFFNSGRDSIRAVLEIFSDKHILVSAYSCRAVVDTLGSHKCQSLTMFDIDSTFYPDVDHITAHLHGRRGDYSDQLFFLGNLWGTRYPEGLLEFLREFRRCGGTVIEDLTHKLDSRPLSESDGWMCSTRKWFGTTGLAALNLFQGGFVASPSNTHTPSSLSMRLSLMGLLRYIPRQSNFRKFIIERLHQTDERLGSNQLISVANQREVRRFRSQDWHRILATRHKNKLKLEECIQQTSAIRIINPVASNQSTFPTTIKISTGQMALRNYLRRNNIFAANLWPLGHWRLFYPAAYSLSCSVLTLPCDQRINEDLSARMADLVNSYTHKESKTIG